MPGAGAGGGAVSWLCTCGDRLLVLVLGAGFRCWCCELAVHVMETGCWCWVPVLGCARDGGRLLVPGAGAGAGAVSWLCRVPVLVL